MSLAIKQELDNDGDQGLSNMSNNQGIRNNIGTSDMSNKAAMRDVPAFQINPIFNSVMSQGDPPRERSPMKRARVRSMSRSSSSESRSRSTSPHRNKRLLTEAEFQQRTLSFQRELVRMQKQTIRLLRELKREVQKSQSHTADTNDRPNLSSIQESLASIHDHEKEKSLIVLDSQRSSRDQSFSDGHSMESFEHRDHQSPHTSLRLDQLASVNFHNPIANIVSLSCAPNSIIERPLTTVEELKQFEDAIKEDSDKMMLLVQQFCRIEANNCREMAKKGLRSLMKKSLMEMLNMEGQRSETTGKKAFKNSIVCNALSDAVLLRFPNTNRTEVLKHIQLQLRYCKRHKPWD